LSQGLTSEEVHRSAIVLDTHADTPQRFVDERWDFTGPLAGGMLSLETARNGNLAGELFALWVEPTQWQGRFAHRAFSLLDGLLEQIRLHPEAMVLCTTADDVLAARASGRFAAMISIEGGHAIEADLGLLRLFYRLGVRAMTLTWSNTNEWADSSGDIDDPAVVHHNGLTDFGREVIAEMNRLGMIVDISHVADKTFWDVLEVSKAPVIASHSSARALTNSARNLTDEMLVAIANTDGVAMVNFYPAFIDEDYRLAWSAQRPERQRAHAALEEEYAGRPVPFAASTLIDREHTARLPRAPFSSLIGTDFDGIPQPPDGIDSAADLPRITAALLERGVSAEDVHKILGGNFLRVFRAVQAVAQP